MKKMQTKYKQLFELGIIVKMGVSGPLSKMEEEGISYEILEELVPTYESSTAKMIFNWGY